MMTEPLVADFPLGKVLPEWQKRGFWLSKAWETFGTPSHVERASQAAKQFTELREGEAPEIYLLCSGIEFPQWRKAPRSPHAEVQAAWLEYCINREAAEMDVDRQLHFGSLFGFGAPRHSGADPEWIPTQAWYGLKRRLDHHDVVRGDGIVYFYVRVIAAEQWLLAAEASTKKGRRPGKDYREADRPIVDQIKAGMEDGIYKNITDGARNLAQKAAGSGDAASKVKRLIGRF